MGASLLALGLATAAAPAVAQDAPSAGVSEVEEVVVTGFRASLRSAIGAKRQETGVVDVIKAEDIAAFPDLNLAESLQRIPGVAISRESGEGRQISVRGLGPDYTRVRLNGIEALATSGSSDSGGGSGTNRSRGFDFNIFASELFNSLTVRKSASADVEEGSLGATVDLQTARPFDYREPTLVLSAQAGYNDLAGEVDPRFAAIASRTWADGKFGALLSVAYGQRHILEEGFGSTRWDTGASQGGFCSPAGYDVNPGTAGVQSNPATTATTCGAGGPPRLAATPQSIAAYNLASSSSTFLPRIPSYNSFAQLEKRLGVTAALQFRPTDRTLITVDGLYAKLDQERNEKALQALGMSRSGTGKPAMTVREFVVDENNNMVSATFDNVDMRTQTRYIEQGTEFSQFTLSGSHEFSDRLKVSALLGRADSEFETTNDTNVTFDRADVQNYRIDFGPNDRVPLITMGIDPTNPASWTAINGQSEVRLRPGVVHTIFDTAKFEVQFDLTDNFTIKAGADRRQSLFKTSEERRLSETVSQTLTPEQIAANGYLFKGYGDGLDLPEGASTAWFVPDVQKYAAAFDIYCNCGIYAISSAGNSSARGATTRVEETNTGAYLMGVFRFDAFGLPIRGDVGVRTVETEQSSFGFAAVGNSVQWVNAERNYRHTLPSFNLAADLPNDVIVRVAAAETIARPTLGSLSPGGDVSIQGANRTFSTGNPNIEPTKSKNLDLSLEWYPEPGALYSLGLFYKNIDTFAQTLRTTAIFNTLGLPLELLNGTPAQPTDEFAVTRPVNSEGGELKGVEVNIQQPFTFLPGFWSNFGIIANYTYVSSDIEYLTSAAPGAPTVTATLVGLSKNAANGTLYYEDEKFSIRGSVAYRDGYLTSVPGRNNNFVEGTNSTLNFDMQASYQLTDALEISFEGINLTDEASDQYVDFTNRVNAYRHSGRQFFIGARYAF
jgi:TonB-dependent receptor